MPGIALIGGGLLDMYSDRWIGSPRWLAPTLVFGIPIVAVIGCGVFASIIAITREDGRDEITPKKVILGTVGFCCLQMIVSVFVAFVIMQVGLAVASAFR